MYVFCIVVSLVGCFCSQLKNMESDSCPSELKLLIKHLGRDYHIVSSTDSTLRSVQQKLESLTAVPLATQKLVHKGRDLAKLDPDMLLVDCRLKDRDTVMLLGAPYDPESDQLVVSIVKIESEAEQLVPTLDDLHKEVDQLGQGYVNGAMTVDIGERLRRKVSAAAELLMRLLERLDALDVAAVSDGRTDSEPRRRRRALVQRINGFMDRADRLLETINQQQQQQ